MADLLEIQEANPFRVRAYRNASRAVAEQVRPLSEMVAAKEDLKSLPGVGKDIAATLEELIRSGRAQALEDLGREIPRGVADLMRLPALGPKRARLLWQKLGIVDLDGLKAAADAGRIAEVSGFGIATQKKILESLERRTAQGKRISIAAADAIVAALLDHLRPAGAARLEAAGSFRRRRETVGDLDLVAAARRRPRRRRRRSCSASSSSRRSSRSWGGGTPRPRSACATDFRSTCGWFPSARSVPHGSTSPARRTTTSSSAHCERGDLREFEGIVIMPPGRLDIPVAQKLRGSLYSVAGSHLASGPRPAWPAQLVLGLSFSLGGHLGGAGELARHPLLVEFLALFQA